MRRPWPTGGGGAMYQKKSLGTKLIVSTTSREFRQTDEKQQWHFFLAQDYSSYDIRA